MVDIKELSEEFQATTQEEILKPSDFVGKKITIVDMETSTGKNGEFGIFTIEGETKRLSTGGQFYKQIRRIKEANHLPISGYVVEHPTDKNPWFGLEDEPKDGNG